MSQVEKLIKRLKSKPTDFKWTELVKILSHFGYTQVKRGKTGGSRRKFKNEKGHRLTFHEPHPQKTLKSYQVEDALRALEEEGLI